MSQRHGSMRYGFDAIRGDYNDENILRIEPTGIEEYPHNSKPFIDADENPTDTITYKIRNSAGTVIKSADAKGRLFKIGALRVLSVNKAEMILDSASANANIFTIIPILAEKDRPSGMIVTPVHCVTKHGNYLRDLMALVELQGSGALAITGIKQVNFGDGDNPANTIAWDRLPLTGAYKIIIDHYSIIWVAANDLLSMPKYIPLMGIDYPGPTGGLQGTGDDILPEDMTLPKPEDEEEGDPETNPPTTP